VWLLRLSVLRLVLGRLPIPLLRSVGGRMPVPRRRRLSVNGRLLAAEVLLLRRLAVPWGRSLRLAVAGGRLTVPWVPLRLLWRRGGLLRRLRGWRGTGPHGVATLGAGRSPI